MITTSEKYRAAVNAPMRYSDARIVFELYDHDAAEAATVPVDGEAGFSRTTQMCDNATSMSGTWATFEPEGFPLGGNAQVPPRKTESPDEQMGFWLDELSDENGNINFIREITFSQEITSVGVTVYFDEPMNVYAINFTIRLQYNTTILNEITITGNTQPQVRVMLAAQNYNRAVIEIHKWSKPNSRVRISEMLFGAIETLTGNDNVVTLQLLSEIDITSESLPSREMTTTLKNIDRRFDQWSPNGIYKYLVDAYPLDTSLGFGQNAGEIDNVFCGRDYFFTAESANGQATALIKTRDKLFRMGSTRYRKGRLAVMTVAEILSEIFEDAGIIEYTIDPVLADTDIVAAMPDVTHREAVRIAAQAGKACAYVDRNGNPVVKRVSIGEPAITIDGENAHEWTTPKTGEYFNAVDVAIYSFIDPGGDARVIAQGSFPGDKTREQWISFRGAAFEPVATATGGEIISQTPYLYGMHLTISGSPEITVNGRLAERSTSSYLLDHSYDEPTTIKELNNPLIATVETALSVAQWRYGLLTQRLTHNVRWRGDVALEVGDTVQLVDEYGQQRNAIVTRIETFYDGSVYQLLTAMGGWQ